MRFTVAWADVLSQNTFFKWLVFLLSLLSLGLGTGLVSLALKDPIVIERACYSRIKAPHSGDHTKGEVKAFVTEALSQRFDSGEEATTYIGSEERVKTLKEREELASKKVRQRVVINQITVEKDKVAIDADRIIAVDDVRTAFRFGLVAKVGTIARSESNPYGMILTSTTLIQAEVKK